LVHFLPPSLPLSLALATSRFTGRGNSKADTVAEIDEMATPVTETKSVKKMSSISETDSPEGDLTAPSPPPPLVSSPLTNIDSLPTVPPVDNSPPKTPPPAPETLPKEEKETKEVSIPSSEQNETLTQPLAPPAEADEPVKPKKLAASGPLAQMFAGRGAGPMDAPAAKSGRGGGAGRGDALAGLFAGRGAGPATGLNDFVFVI
jgi:hypothetical protein